MARFIVVFLFSCLVFFRGYSQTDTISPAKKEHTVYTIKNGIEIPITGAITVWCAYTLPLIYKKPKPTEEEIFNLKTSDLSSFDRWGVYPFSQSMSDASDIPFYTTLPMPFILFLTGKDMRSDYGQLSILYWETLAAIGIMGTTATAYVDRYRPYAYFHDSPEAIAKATSKVARNSFYAGHIEIVAASSFFMAKVLSDYHPDSKIKWVYFGAAALTTASTAYFRLKSGSHFPSDILLGLTTGTLSGILVPHFHKKDHKDGGMSILPYHMEDINGLTMTYTIR